MDFSKRRFLTIAGSAVASTFISAATHGAIMDLVASENDDLSKATRAIRNMLDIMPKGYWSYDGLWSRNPAPRPEMFVKRLNPTVEEARARFPDYTHISDDIIVQLAENGWPNPDFDAWSALDRDYDPVRKAIFSDDNERLKAERDLTRKADETLAYLLKLIENNPSRENARSIFKVGVVPPDISRVTMETTLELIPLTFMQTLVGREMVPFSTAASPAFDTFAKRYKGLIL